MSSVTMVADGVELDGELVMPTGAHGLVMFAHGSGSSRFSPRNVLVAQILAQHGFATLLFNLLTRQEEREDAYDAHLRFDIPLLARRLAGATDWAGHFAPTRPLTIGYFGASTGAAAALIAAASRPSVVKCVVSRGGRPDLAADALPRVHAATLLIVGGWDDDVLALNRQALRMLRAPAELTVVPRATHLFQEPGSLEKVAKLAASWFERYLGAHTETLAPAGWHGS